MVVVAEAAFAASGYQSLVGFSADAHGGGRQNRADYPADGRDDGGEIRLFDCAAIAGRAFGPRTWGRWNQFGQRGAAVFGRRGISFIVIRFVIEWLKCFGGWRRQRGWFRIACVHGRCRCRRWGRTFGNGDARGDVAFRWLFEHPYGVECGADPDGRSQFGFN